MKKYNIVLVVYFLFIFSSCAQESTESIAYTHEVVVSDLDIPWGFVFLPDNSILITEKSGTLIHFKDGKKTEVSGLPKIKVLGQGGLLDIALHPKYATEAWIYISYVSSDGEGEGANTTIMRCKLKNNDLVEKQVLYKASPNSKKGYHFGSRIAFDTNGYLYFSVGDRGSRDENPQDINRDGGKIYRLHDDGKIPVDNPFVKDTNAKTAIYSYGHRNPQGMARHPETGKIWTHEHGPKGGDEINTINAGKNYGWPKICYGINYDGTTLTEHTSLPGMEQPLHYWTPSIAPSGMAFVTSEIYPDWKGNLLVGSLKFQYISRCVLENDKVIKEEKILEGIGRIRSIEQGNDGYIYAGVENVGIVKIVALK